MADDRTNMHKMKTTMVEGTCASAGYTHDGHNYKTVGGYTYSYWGNPHCHM